MPFYTEDIMDQAYRWLCRQRKDYHFNNDVWHLRFHWAQEKEKLVTALRNESFAFECVRAITTPGWTTFLWTARDALVLKAITLYLEARLRPQLSERIFHLAGTGGEKRGIKAAVREVYRALPDAKFVLRTDVKSYYASIDHELLLKQLKNHVDNPFLLRLLRSFLRHHTCREGRYHTITQGIAPGCPLSPLLGALFLKPLDDAMAKTGLFYVRFMDDWIVLSPTRWKLRRAIAAMNACLEALELRKHPDKTSIGRTTAGFDSPGYRFCLETAVQPQENKEASAVMGTSVTLAPETAMGGGPPVQGRKKRPQGENARPSVRLQPAVKTLQHVMERCSRLYEQAADEGRIGNYIIPVIF